MTNSYVYSVSGSPLQPSEVSYRAIALTASVELEWPFSNIDTTETTAMFMDITPDAGGYNVTLPPANQTSVGYAVIINNPGAFTFTVLDNDGGTIQAIASGNQYYLLIRNNSTAAGAWRVVAMGIGTTSASASALAGQGLKAISTTLNVDSGLTTTAAPYAISTVDRGETILWTGGTDTFTIAAAATLTNGFFCYIRNGGSGTLTLNPNGSETINGSTTLSMDQTDSCMLVCDGANFFTVGLGRAITSTDSRTSISVAGSSNVTLSTTQASNNILEFTGLLTGNINVIFPATAKNYFVFNNTTGAFTLTCKTAAGTGVAITQGTYRIITCDGTNVVYSDSVTTGTVTSITAGTGLSGGTITSTGTISITATGVSAGTYRFATVTLNAQGQATAASESALTINTQTGDYTLVLGDANSIMELTGATGRTYTIPPNASVAFPLGSLVFFTQSGTGVLTIAAGVGVTINSEDGLILNTQYSVAGAIKMATNTWILFGSVRAA